ncbi:MAG: hypothetical protein IT353_04615 [Gemmatimonadaceae bacterium]|nr:hypothetical protein [Gemmatimonadaceae bacterium]
MDHVSGELKPRLSGALDLDRHAIERGLTQWQTHRIDRQPTCPREEAPVSEEEPPRRPVDVLQWCINHVGIAESAERFHLRTDEIGGMVCANRKPTLLLADLLLAFQNPDHRPILDDGRPAHAGLDDLLCFRHDLNVRRAYCRNFHTDASRRARFVDRTDEGASSNISR